MKKTELKPKKRWKTIKNKKKVQIKKPKMKKIMFLFAALSMVVLCSCGSANKSEQEEMDKFQDSIKQDTSISSSVDAANAFLSNDSAAVDTTVKK